MAAIRKRYDPSKSKTDENTMGLPKITDATDDQKKLPLEDKLKIIDDEIRLLRDFCVQSGYSKGEIENCASPVLDFLKVSNRSKLKRGALKMVLLVSVFAFLYYYDPAFNVIRAYTRYGQLKTLQYWDWAHWYDEDCLINNPYFNPVSLYESDCEGCEGILEIEKIDEVTNDEIMDDFLFNHVPIIITDAMADWKAFKQFDMDFIAKLYLDDPVLNTSQICAFHTFDSDSHLKPILHQIQNGNLKQWHMSWQNCDDHPVRVMRRFYSRPYFVPPMVEMASANWLFTDSGLKRTKNAHHVTSYDHSLSTDSSMTWFAQVKGQYKVKLTPDELCNNTCSELTAILDPGEILAFTNTMWSFQYMVVGTDDAIAIAASGSWD